MTTMWRLFLAIPLAPQVSQQLNDWLLERTIRTCSTNNEDVSSLPLLAAFRRDVHPQDYHITVQFLGDVFPARAAELQASLDEAVTGCKPFELQVQGMGSFGSPAAPRILWAGVEGQTEQLHQLQQRIVAATSLLGFAPEERPYRPHITLARQYTGQHEGKQLGVPASLWRELAAHMPSLSWTVNGVALYRTHLDRRPMYEAVHTACFVSG
ncbi:RNA 2',3'-cyclic phosphodiesterase [Paenibacillus sp. 481]|uniref:RNA 2',3'-cyclic phosphodiesterase n=1 Tax=Paenibacillus sp. 481 TaxID=2835869 RepID=UPI001E2F1167|nr:RNA 2',3'-cyclic phosphodiesterase [Paenibacillus sp. 481]UHA74783.1 RNA 2',3'-cyclic phosphodiesterase [Paenibacillus sp. 481]